MPAPRRATVAKSGIVAQLGDHLPSPPKRAADGRSAGESVVPAQDSPAAPGSVPGVRLAGELGRGAYTVVYRAERAGRYYALKVLRGPGSPRETVLLRREAALLASLDHPGLTRVYEVGEADGQPYLIMDLVEGQSLAQVLREAGRLDEVRVATLGAHVAAALAAAHRAGMVHRDVKPGNIMVAADGKHPGDRLRARGRSGADTARRGGRHVPVQRAGADRHAAPGGRRPGRPVRAGRRAVRVPDRLGAVHRRRRRRAGPAAPERAGARRARSPPRRLRPRSRRWSAGCWPRTPTTGTSQAKACRGPGADRGRRSRHVPARARQPVRHRRRRAGRSRPSRWPR